MTSAETVHRRQPRVRGASGLLGVVLLVAGATPAAGAADPAEDGLWYFTAPGIAALHTRSTGEGVVVAVLDGPINPAAPDLVGANLVTAPASFCDEDLDRVPDPATSTGSEAEHATNVTAVVVGTGAGAGGEPGTRGIAPGATVHHYAVDSDGTTCGLDGVVSEALALDQAVADGADVVNMSFSRAVPAPELIDAIARAQRAGVILVAASNSRGGTELGWPAAANGVVSVESADVDLQLPENAVNNPRLAVVAPGQEIRVVSGADGTWQTYTRASGSSLAAPWVCGLLALIMSEHPDATSHQVVQTLLRNTSQGGGELVQQEWFGYGTASASAAFAADPTVYPDVNPLVVDLPDAMPAYDALAGGTDPGPTDPGASQDPGASTDPVAPTPAPDAGAGSALVPVLVGGVMVLVLVGIGVAVAVSRRSGPARRP